MANLEEQLGHANGAAEDIILFITSGVGVNASPEIHELARSILHRFLSSAQKEWKAPSYFIHAWEKEEWEHYLKGKTKACATTNPTIEEAQRLNE